MTAHPPISAQGQKKYVPGPGPTQRQCVKSLPVRLPPEKPSFPPSLGFFLPDAPPPSRRPDSHLPTQVIPGFWSVDPCGPLRIFRPPTIGTSILVEFFFCYPIYGSENCVSFERIVSDLVFNPCADLRLQLAPMAEETNVS
jgi:hypothetical protein